MFTTDTAVETTPLGAQIAQCQALLERTRRELIDAETELAERLTAVEQFEFRLRASLAPQMSRLEALQKEIDRLRRELRQTADDWGDMDRKREVWSVPDMENVFHTKGATAAGQFRYRPAPPPPPEIYIDPEMAVALKQLYRQLARRFHPDMAVDEQDRARRTELMTAVNAAYSAGDLDQLRQLALEPDLTNPLDAARTEAELLAALQEELARCLARLEEIQAELRRLNRRKSARLLRQALKAEADGRDWLAEMMAQMKAEITRKMVEQDILQSELELARAFADEETLAGGDFADAVWQMSLDQAVGDDDPLELESWLRRRWNKSTWYDENEDDIESWS